MKMNANNVVQAQAFPTKPTKIPVTSFGSFPAVGSMLGDFFCLGRLGKGTFCSIHKCCALDYWQQKKARIVAAKVELSDFANSGVLDGEAFMLQHLDQSLPPNKVPAYVGHFASEKASAIVMEFLGGDDMHQLRDKTGSRRISVQDAVYLTADVLLPLLRNMHDAGIVHRDVKPSNCVRKKGKEFCMVDFGLSKSIIVPKDSPQGDRSLPFSDTHCFRQERETADFRGTSMYASLRVHQSRDYCRRDDMWSVLYVFCDLVSGGLPWMSYAANRDREMCRKIKEEIHGTHDQTDRMLMGEQYHLAWYKERLDGKTADLPAPLAISRDEHKVGLLRTAFAHLASLGFADAPDYDLLRKCLHGFLDEPLPADNTPLMEWTDDGQVARKRKRQRWDEGVPLWEDEEINDPLDEDGNIWNEAESQAAEAGDGYNQASDMMKLPVELQFRVAQMDYHNRHFQDSPPHIVLRDWMRCALPLVYGEWDSSRFERGNHRTNDDGFRREVFLKIVDKCLKCAERFSLFRGRSFYYDTAFNPERKRKTKCSLGNKVAVSRAIIGLQQAKTHEMKKRFAPPPTLSFSQS